MFLEWMTLTMTGSVLFLIGLYKKIRILKKEVRILIQNIKMQEGHLEEMIESEKEIRNLKHDISNYLLAARVMEDLEIMPVRALLNAKEEVCHQEGISTVWNLEALERLPLKEADAVSLFANLLDNAIFACTAQKEGSSLEAAVQEAQTGFSITVKNSCNYNKIMEMKKRRGGEHGRGLIIVRDIVDKYGGTYKAAEENGFYTTRIQIPHMAEPCQLEG